MISKEEMLEIERIEKLMVSLILTGDTIAIEAFIKKHSPIMRNAIPKLLEVAHAYFDLVEEGSQNK